MRRTSRGLGVDAPKSETHATVEILPQGIPVSLSPAPIRDDICASAQVELDRAWQRSEEMLDRLREEDREGGDDAA